MLVGAPATPAAVSWPGGEVLVELAEIVGGGDEALGGI
jgi:hypothetical protein